MRLAALALLLLAAAPLSAQGVSDARYLEPTDRYGHGILGDAIEWGALEMETGGGPVLIRLPDTHVFEDTWPRLADLDGDGDAEVIVVETAMAEGARLSVYDETGLVAATPHIGRTHRWLSPIGAADLDGDGLIEIAYVDRPHLAKTVRIWRFEDGGLTEVAAASGVTNHRIGEEDIAGGIRDCGSGPEMIVATADWTRLLALTFDGQEIAARDIGPHRDRSSFADAMAC